MRTVGKPGVTPEVIAHKALEIIDRKGLASLSMHAVARELGIRAPSLYYHYTDKDEILTAVARLVLLETPVLPLPAPRRWRSWLVEQCLEFRRTILRHPNAAPLLLGYIPRELFSAQYERASLILDRAGVPLELHVLIFEAIDKLTLGSAMYAATTGPDPVFFPDLDASSTPTVAAAVELTTWSVEEVFVRALRGFLDCIPSASPGWVAARQPTVSSEQQSLSRRPRRTVPPRGASQVARPQAETRRQPATRRLIAETALSLIDSEGLNSVSVKKVAANLGIRGPSVYHHFVDKAELLTAVARLVLLETPILAEPADPSAWREWEVQQSLGYRRAILRHPNAAPLLLGYRPRKLFADVYERAARVLVAAGVPYRYHLIVFETTDKFTLGSAMYAASTTDHPEFFPALDTEQTPMLAKALSTNPWDSEEIFVEALRNFLAVVPDGRRQLR